MATAGEAGAAAVSSDVDNRTGVKGAVLSAALDEVDKGVVLPIASGVVAFTSDVPLSETFETVAMGSVVDVTTDVESTPTGVESETVPDDVFPVQRGTVSGAWFEEDNSLFACLIVKSGKTSVCPQQRLSVFVMKTQAPIINKHNKKEPK